jgi:hypothetical protein
VRCSVCGSAVFVPNKRTPGKAIIANEEVEAWIRTSCGCGKVIKVPPEWGGRTGQCPRCFAEVIMPRPVVIESTGEHEATEVLEADPPSPANAGPLEPWKGTTPVPNPNPQPARQRDEQEVNERPDRPLPSPKPKPMPGLTHVSATASSGSSIDLNAPVVKVRKHSSKPAVNPDASAPTPSRSLTHSGLLDLTNREQVPIVDGFAANTWSALRDQRFRQVVGSSPGNIVRFVGRAFAHSFRTRPMAPLSVGVIFIAAVAAMGFAFRPPAPVLARPDDPPHDVYYYDLQTGDVFSHINSDLSPIVTPWQQPGSTPRGVRAYIYTCGHCVSNEWDIMFVETYSPPAREAWVRHNSGGKADASGAPPSATAGRMIADPKKQQWVSITDAGAREFIERPATRACAEGKYPRRCIPPSLLPE